MPLVVDDASDMSYLELVLLGLRGRRRVQKINSENLDRHWLASLTMQSFPAAEQWNMKPSSQCRV